MDTSSQTENIENSPLDSEYWQTRTEPLGSEDWEPFWAARIVFFGGVVFFLAAAICAVGLALGWPDQWPEALGSCGGVFLLFMALVRHKQRLRRLRDLDLQRRIRKFRAYRKAGWDSLLPTLANDGALEFLDANGIVLSNPLKEPLRRVLLVRNGNLLAELHQRDHRVGSVNLALISSDQTEAERLTSAN